MTTKPKPYLSVTDRDIIAQAFRDEVAEDEATYASFVPDVLYVRGAERAVAAVNKAHKTKS